MINKIVKYKSSSSVYTYINLYPHPVVFDNGVTLNRQEDEVLKEFQVKVMEVEDVVSHEAEFISIKYKLSGKAEYMLEILNRDCTLLLGPMVLSQASKYINFLAPTFHEDGRYKTKDVLDVYTGNLETVPVFKANKFYKVT